MSLLRTLSVLVLAALVLLAAGCSSPWTGPPSEHFDGQRFFNPGVVKDSSVTGYLRLRLTTSQPAWPDAVVLAPQPPPPPQRDDGSAGITWVGHATVLIQVAGMNLLTDPVWAERASPLSFVGPRRVSPPAIAFDALPRIDVVLISHDHYDHLDLATLRRLDARDRPRVLVPLGNAPLVRDAMPASTVSEHDWGERVSIGTRLKVHVEPMQHGSGRSPFDQMATLWASYLIEADGLKLLFVGDTGYGGSSLWRGIAARHGAPDLAILPIGAYEPRSFMADSHMGPDEAVKLMLDLGARQALAHHFEAFQLGFEAYEAPRRDLAAALAAAGLDGQRFRALQPGESWRIEARR